jgi:Skp family chaperone for outer membrane proteins
MKKTLIAALAFGAATGAAFAQEAAAPAGGELKMPRIAVIDMAKVSSESLIGKTYASKLEALQNEITAEGTKKQNQLQKLDDEIKALQDEFEKQSTVLSQDAADRKRQEIVRKGRERQAFLEDGQAELQRMRERAQQQAQGLNNEFQQKIKPYIEAVAKEKKIDILLDGQVALTVNAAFDISREVIVKADDAERAKGGAPAAAPSPSPGQ